MNANWYQELIATLDWSAIAPELVEQIKLGPPPLPHAVWGPVTIDGVPAPVGTLVYGLAKGAIFPAPGNPLVTTVAGQVGAGGGFGRKLIIQGRIEQGGPVYFYVNGMMSFVRRADGEWLPSLPFDTGEVEKIELRV